MAKQSGHTININEGDWIVTREGNRVIDALEILDYGMTHQIFDQLVQYTPHHQTVTLTRNGQFVKHAAGRGG